MLDHLKGYDIVLVSRSPRRRELLARLGLTFTTAASTVKEDYPPGLHREQIPLYLSQQKARNAECGIGERTLVIAADTIVCLDDEVLGKPRDEEEACQMLHRLSGRVHHVITGVTVKTKKRETSFFADSEVHFAPLTSDEIDYYVRQYHPLDKAGAYGIQEWIGMAGISGINGSFYNVMGLPVHRLYQLLKTFEPCC